MLTCPVCDLETKSYNGVAGLTSNTTLRALVEEAILQAQLAGNIAMIKCQACVEQNTAVSRCMDCDHFLCDDCQRAHQRLIAMSSHQIVIISDLQSGKITFKSKLRNAVHKCSKHADQNLCFFCKTCDILICTTCTVLDHSKPDHSYMDIETAMDTCRSEITNLMSRAEGCQALFKDAEAVTMQAQQRLKHMVSETHQKISVKADQEVTKIRDMEQQLKRTTQEAYLERIEMLGNAKSNHSVKIKMSHQSLKNVGRVMSQASHSEVLSLKTKIIKNLRGVIETKQDAVPYVLSYINFKESKTNKNLGRLLMSEKWELKTMFSGEGDGEVNFDDLFHVAPFPNGNILAFDRGRNQIMVISPTGKLQNLPDTASLNLSTDIAVTDDNKVVFTSNVTERQVTKFDAEKNLFSSVTPWEGSQELTCLTVIDGNLVAVGDKEQGRIGLLDPNGTLLKTLPANMIGHYLTYNKATKQLIYTDYETGRLLAVDLNSNKRFSVETLDKRGNQVFPSGVCCDGTGDIYVAIQKSKCRSGKDEIYHYTSEGIFVRQEVFELFDVCGITFSADGDLVVADCHSLKIYHIK